jgi:hypothetical protein
MGLQYEQRVQEYMRQYFNGDGDYTPNPWISYRENGKTKWCQPDGLLRTPKGYTVCEIKLQHTKAAWDQLWQLYIPLVELILSSCVDVRGVEIVRWYDPHVAFPEHHLISSPALAPKAPVTGVHILRL